MGRVGFMSAPPEPPVPVVAKPALDADKIYFALGYQATAFVGIALSTAQLHGGGGRFRRAAET